MTKRKTAGSRARPKTRKKVSSKKVTPKQAPKKSPPKTPTKKSTALSTKVRSRKLTKPKPQPIHLEPKHSGFWSIQVKELVRSLCAPKAEPEEFDLFIMVCKQTNLNPLMRQIYCIHRWNSKMQRETMTIQVSIDSLRLIAERTGKYLGGTKPEWYDCHAYRMKADKFEQMALANPDMLKLCDPDDREDLQDDEVWLGQWVETWSKQYVPHSARVGVYKAGLPQPTYAVAKWSEFAPDTEKPEGFFWKKSPCHMIAKCAEAQALRRAFPQELSGIYIHEEMPVTNQVPSADQEERLRQKYEKDLTREAKRFHILCGKCKIPREKAMDRLREIDPNVKDSAKDTSIEVLQQVNHTLELQAKKVGTRRGKPREEQGNDSKAKAAAGAAKQGQETPPA